MHLVVVVTFQSWHATVLHDKPRPHSCMTAAAPSVITADGGTSLHLSIQI